MKKHTKVIYCSVLAMNLLAFDLFGQAGFDSKQLEEKFYKSRNVSFDLVRNYTWDSRTDVTREGKIMDILIEHLSYGPDGKIQRTITNNQEAKLPSSFLIHQVAEDMKTKLVTFMNDLHVFLEEYALEDQGKASVFFSKANIGSPDKDGHILVSGEDVITKGDRLLWWIDTHNYTIAKASISTTFEGDQVEFTATYKYILPGVNYMAFAEVLVPAKSITVMLHCYDYGTKSD
jgi:hypothetical protein